MFYVFIYEEGFLHLWNREKIDWNKRNERAISKPKARMTKNDISEKSELLHELHFSLLLVPDQCSYFYCK